MAAAGTSPGFFQATPLGNYAALLDAEGGFALERAVGITPDFAERWSLLGFAHGLSPAPSGRAVEALETAADLLPGRADVLFNLLLAHARAGQRQAVEAMIDRLERLGADATTLARARETRVQVMYREAVALVRKTELDTALPLLARVLSESSDPQLKRSVEALVPQVMPVARHNRFAASYLEILDLYRAGAIADARAAAARLATVAGTDKQYEAIAVLRAFLDSLP